MCILDILRSANATGVLVSMLCCGDYNDGGATTNIKQDIVRTNVIIYICDAHKVHLLIQIVADYDDGGGNRIRDSSCGTS